MHADGYATHAMYVCSSVHNWLEQKRFNNANVNDMYN